MFKFVLKLCLITFAILGIASLFSTSKVAADSALCPSGISRANSSQIPSGYGYNKGEQIDGFGGLVVASSVGNMTNGQPDSKGRGGNPIDAKYNLNSYLPDAPGGQQYHLDGHPQHKRIFTVDASNNTTNRDDQRWFGTNGSTGDNLYAGNGGGFICPGWDALGPGMAGEIGNRHALDCGEAYYSPGSNIRTSFTPTRFWISDIPSPNGESGHWQIQLYAPNGTRDFTFSPGSMGPGDTTNYFTITNGQTIRINLIWHADPPPPPDNPNLTSECTYLDVRDGGGATINGKSFDENAIRTSVRVYDSNGHVMVHADGDPNSFIYFNQGTRHWDYNPPLGRQVTVQVYRQYLHNNNGNWQWDDIPNGSLDGNGQPYQFTNGQAGNQTRTHNCYSSSCSIYVPSNVAGKPLGVKAGQTMTVYITINNLAGTSSGPPNGLTIPGNLAGHDWLFLSDGNQSPGLEGINYHLPTIGRGGTFTTSIPIRAPSTGGIYTFSAVPVYPGLLYTQVSPCTYSFDVYQPFNASASASTTLTPNREEPTNADYSTTVNVSPSSPSVYIPTTSIFCKQPVGSGQQTCNLPATSGQQNIATNGGGTYPPDHWSGNYGIPPGSFTAGDQYCTSIYINYTTGWIGPHGPTDVAEPSGSNSSAPNCRKVINEPYAHFFGNDVRAGGGFGNSCQKTSKGVIYTYNNTPGGAANAANKGGTGTQFGAHAMDIISGLGSASLRSNAPTGLSGLSFANTENIGGSAPSPTTGGFLGNAGLSNFCVPDYFGDKPASVTSNTGTTATAGSGATQQWYKPAGGTLTLGGGTINNGVNQAIFVEGNVNITGDIKYSTAARGSVKDIPSFYLVVKNGNIRINPGVKQLDGVYAAQPDTTNATTINQTGIINTCFIGNGFDQIYNQCKNQLVINGAFVANRVLLARSYSSLRFSQSGENNMGGAAHNCGNAGKDVPAGSTSAQDCAAEIFNFSPELYMSQPAINARFGAPSGKYDAITSLSPVL